MMLRARLTSNDTGQLTDSGHCDQHAGGTLYGQQVRGSPIVSAAEDGASSGSEQRQD
jgi:hypothetical protein